MRKTILIALILASSLAAGCVQGDPHVDQDAAIECPECPECPEPPECPVECDQLAREMAEAIKLLRILQYEPEPWRVTSLIELGQDYDDCVLDHQR